ncbi:MAG: hypothetical protein EP343_24430 [Deltaproteobacteria bacterium]|nr:MAG: hypothetical protein EP343_24430 [Deltaproteobacteria bacterium]
MLGSLRLTNPAAQQYFSRLQQALSQQPDGSWLGREEHQQACQRVCGYGSALARDLITVLQQSSNIVLRSEALRIAGLANLRNSLGQQIVSMMDRASYRPIFGRKLQSLYNMWYPEQAPPMDTTEQYLANLEQHMWFGLPGQASPTINGNLPVIASQGEPGLFAIDQLLGRILDEGYLMSYDHLVLFMQTSQLFVEHNYFEGVQIFFDFLADCAPVAPQKDDLATIGSVLKAVRKLRPYRYPQWSTPLGRFVQHFRSIKQMGRAMEANMLIILISASELEEALLLEDDELVDLLRGRRDSAYTEQELEDVATLCDAVLESGRSDARMYHIRGWLAARLEGPDAAEPFFKQAIAINPSYVYPHLALSAIYGMKDDEGARDHHLAAACQSDPSQISCHRQYGEHLQRSGRDDEALDIYQRGAQIKPDQVTVLELEEYFGCLAAMANIHAHRGAVGQAVQVLESHNESHLIQRFSARFCERNRVILDLLSKGLRDYRAELQRSA